MTILAKVQNGVLTLPADAPPLPEGAEVEVSLPEARAVAPEQGGAMGWMLAYACTIDDLPEDSADEHDHYIRGTPKRNLNPCNGFSPTRIFTWSCSISAITTTRRH